MTKVPQIFVSRLALRKFAERLERFLLSRAARLNDRPGEPERRECWECR